MMKVTRNPVLGTWEMAESDGAMPRGAPGLKPCDTARILVVDDETQTRSLYCSILKNSFPHVECDQAPDGARAIETFTTHHPHVVVMDILMPVMNGEEAYYEIADFCEENGWECPRFVFCSGHSPSAGLRNVVASDPAHCLLQKPIRKQILVAAVSKRVHLRPGGHQPA